MSLARRLAHRGSASSARTPLQGRGGAPRSTPRAAPRSAVAGGGPCSGFTHEVVELSVARAEARPSVVADDLAGLELPTAGALAEALGTLAPAPAAGLDPRCPAVMFDLETTGLLGQAGSLVCVAGAAWHVASDRLRVEQWSLGRAGAEADLLAHLDAALRERIGPRCAFVTFNGGSFDLPLLRRRMVRHGIYAPTDDPLRAPHVDLLPPARRLWRDRGPDCRLGTLERRYLRLRRAGDVSGAEVVELLWRWLEAPNADAADDLARVQRHNRIDVLSLAALARAMHERLLRPTDPVERMRAARHHERLGRGAQAMTTLEPLLRALARGAARGRGSDLTVDAGMLAAQIERRAGRHDAAARLWARVCRSVPGHPPAHEALAKFLEHRARQPGAALAIALGSETPCERRVARLRARVKATAGSVPAPPAAQVIDRWADRLS